MIKVLKKFQVQMSPFQATKDWALNNTDNENLILFESTGSDDSEPIALEYIDYDSGIGLPVTNSYCDVALETQDADRVVFREGQKVTGPFYPDTDPTNPDGTYKRSIYYQVKSSFYNDYRDFTKLLGVEKLDFELSKTKRRLEDNIKLFDIPRLVFGDKIVPNTVEIPSDTLDNDLTIVDDGNGNLFAGTNLFSKQQEIGDFYNVFVTGSNFNCAYYFITNPPPAPIHLTASLFNVSSSVLTWQTSSSAIEEDGFIIERSDNIIPFVIHGIVGHGVLTINDYMLQVGHLYTYRVYAYTTFERSGYSNTASVYISGTGSAPQGIPTLTASLVWITAPTNLVVSLLPIIGSSVTSSLTWTDNSDNEDGFIVGRSTDGLSWSTITTTGANTESYYDANVLSASLGLTYYYRVHAFNSATSSAYSNTASVNCDAAIETFEEYSVGQSSSFNGGQGWTSEWLVVPGNNLVSWENWNRFALNQSSSFNNNNTIYGWSGTWLVSGNSFDITVAQETWEYYSVGQTSNFNSGSGWTGIWKLQTSGSI